MATSNDSTNETELNEGTQDGADGGESTEGGPSLDELRSNAREAKKALRAKHVAQLEKVLYADDGARRGDEASRDDEDGAAAKSKGGKGGGKAEAAKGASKSLERGAKGRFVAGEGGRGGGTDEGDKGTKAAGKGGKAEPQQSKADGEQEDEKGTAAELRAEKRKFSAFRARETRVLQGRERTVTERERRLAQTDAQLKGEIDAWEKDPIAWLQGRGVNVKQALLDWAKQDGEDPKDRLLREAREKAESVEKRLTEREKSEAEAAKKREQEEAIAGLTAEALEQWESVRESDDYPYLSTLYESKQVAELAVEVGVLHYRKTKQELTAGECFARLEKALRLEDDARTKARNRARGDADDAGASRSPDRVRSVSKSENPEANERRPTHDVTNRSTRVATTGDGQQGQQPNGEKPRYDRSKLVAMARDAMTS